MPVSGDAAGPKVPFEAGVVMTLAQDGHGTGMLAGMAATSLMLARRRQPDPFERGVES
jgi:hypothetical protein